MGGDLQRIGRGRVPESLAVTLRRDAGLQCCGGVSHCGDPSFKAGCRSLADWGYEPWAEVDRPCGKRPFRYSNP